MTESNNDNSPEGRPVFQRRKTDLLGPSLAIDPSIADRLTAARVEQEIARRLNQDKQDEQDMQELHTLLETRRRLISYGKRFVKWVMILIAGLIGSCVTSGTVPPGLRAVLAWLMHPPLAP